ncbi:MAG: TetR/AcrR family transcriptional regulator [Cyclobacteriaceae bacterium]
MAEKGNREKWIDSGYEYFGQMGPESLNVERLSMMVGLNRSSFYHYFSDVQIFESFLLEHHIDLFRELGQQLEHCQSFKPDLLNLLLSLKKQMAFHRQLLIHESVPRYKECFRKAKNFTENRTFELWSKQSHLAADRSEQKSLYKVIRDFYLMHYNQTEANDVHKVIDDIQSLFHDHESIRS